MTTGFAGILDLGREDPRKTEFVLNLLLKTKEGKVSWTKKGNAYTATVPNGVVVNFVLAPVAILGGTPNWQLFTVRDATGNELIEVSTPNFVSVFSNLVVTTGPLMQATNQLYAAVTGIAGDALGRAIDSLKKL